MNIDDRHRVLGDGKEPRAEAQQLELLAANNIDVVVLARYMQVLSTDFKNLLSYFLHIRSFVMKALILIWLSRIGLPTKQDTLKIGIFVANAGAARQIATPR